MTPERWQKVKEIFNAALAVTGEERDTFLNRACAADGGLRREVDSLLSSFRESDSVIEAPVAETVTQLWGGSESNVQPGKRLAHYEIAAFLGEGGMATVYLARDTKLGRNVALKLLPSHFTNDVQRLRRFEQEACAASALNHTNILTIYEIGDSNGVHFIATEFIEGETLRERLKRAPMKISEVLSVAEQIASALAAAHEAGIIHRDIKPENIMVRSRDGIVKLLDFGVAKLAPTSVADIGTEAPTKALLRTDPAVIIGTVSYMSPEQARGLKLDGRTDIFSLGVVAYEMTAGCRPFEGSTAGEVLAEVLNEKEPPPLARFAREVPRELEHIISKALRKDQEKRYQTIKDMLIDLKDLQRDLEVQAQLERSVPARARASGAIEKEEITGTTETVHMQGAQTRPESSPHATSSAEYIFNQVKQRKRGAAITLGVLLVGAVVSFWYFKNTRATPLLTEKDSIVLADFVNTTGDAAFDGALKQALAMQLEQSPFLNIFSNERVRETLRFMNRSPDERVTNDVAREICQRQGLKAYLAGSISNLGNHYVITLEAVNGHTGDTLARQQGEAESKEKVLSALGQAAIKLREKFGESLASLQKYDAPIEQVTTASLEALKAYSMGRELHLRGKEPEAIPLLKRAIELDPNFARAHDALAYSYSNLGQTELARAASTKAFELRDRASEYEKLKAESHYFSLVTGEIEKAIETLELLTRTYPRDYNAHNSLASLYNESGRHERAIEEAREAIRLNPNINFAYRNLAIAFIRLNRFDEAKQIYAQALALKIDRTSYHTGLYAIAFVQGDTEAMQKQLDWTRGRRDEYYAFFWQAEAAEFAGKMRIAQELYQRTADVELSRNLKEEASATLSRFAPTPALVGNCELARHYAARVSALPQTDFSFSRIGIALALCGEPGRALAFADEGVREFPQDTLFNAVWLPTIRAAIEIRRDDPAQAIQILQSANRYNRVGVFFPEYLRAQAYLAQGAGAEAAAEFQKILDRRGLAPTSVLYPLAQLGLGRAASRQGDLTKARTAYQNFFGLWKDADPDIPIFLQAKAEYEKLR